MFCPTKKSHGLRGRAEFKAPQIELGDSSPVSIEERVEQYLSRKARLNVINLALDVAADNKELDIKGNVLWVNSADSETTSAMFLFDEFQTTGIAVSWGFFLKGVEFDKPRYSHSAISGGTLQLIYMTEGLQEISALNRAFL